MTADSTSYSTNSVNLGADPDSYRTNAVKLVVDPAKSYCSSNNVSNTFWRTISHQTKSADLKVQNMQALVQKSFAVIANWEKIASELNQDYKQKLGPIGLPKTFVWR